MPGNLKTGRNSLVKRQFPFIIIIDIYTGPLIAELSSPRMTFGWLRTPASGVKILAHPKAIILYKKTNNYLDLLKFKILIGSIQFYYNYN